MASSTARSPRQWSGTKANRARYNASLGFVKKFYDESLDEVAPGVYHVTRKQLRGGDVKKMSTEEKMIARIKNVPSDYTYTEAKNLAKRFGYEEQNKGRTSGSRVLLYRKRDQRKILLHKPHPGDIMQQYAVKQYLTNLIENGDIDG